MITSRTSLSILSISIRRLTATAITTCYSAGEAGTDSESQITAFEDTWHWNRQAEETYHELINEPDQVGRMIESFRQFIGNNQMMAYLVMMAVRILVRPGIVL